jgi:hypothetical protein
MVINSKKKFQVKDHIILLQMEYPRKKKMKLIVKLIIIPPGKDGEMYTAEKDSLKEQDQLRELSENK